MNISALGNWVEETKHSVERLEGKVEEILRNIVYKREEFEYQKGKIKMLEDQSIQKIQYSNNGNFRDSRESNERK